MGVLFIRAADVYSVARRPRDSDAARIFFVTLEGDSMAAYTCEKCGMSIGTMTCGKCGKELKHSTLTKPDGSSVHISECPEGHGKVKSPMCCGQDMSCTI
jgi:hypothetical protein